MNLNSRNAARLLALVALNTATGQAKTCTTTREQEADNYGQSYSFSYPQGRVSDVVEFY